METPAQPSPARHYTFTDYQSWPKGERWEIIGGVAYNMAPAPSTRHQTVAGNLFALLHARLASQPCRPFVAPTTVKFSKTDVVQPDLFVVCDPRKITESHIEGAPDLVVEEVLSPSTTARDLRKEWNGCLIRVFFAYNSRSETHSESTYGSIIAGTQSPLIRIHSSRRSRRGSNGDVARKTGRALVSGPSDQERR